ncbi:outer membrane beta-barrel protein [Marinobacter sp. TBZ242]|uniref:Outer membrane beta-barrel protein n=1 Tax=Marinobacter azerbaijanicus TaxID=3050455 RepID=A0ABT7I6I3_9GAMM|nr:outer membrane beta-barrel protein [Marinobacter sp. TBZ242]MDL0429724.1 outer membrane beta-barrel protein [Marinobacter sp. TBZ242]
MVDVFGSGKIRWIASIGTGLLIATTGPAIAATNSLSGGIDNRFSDNARRTSSDEQSDLETQVNLNFQHLSDPGQCTSSVDMRVGYTYWHDDAFDSEAFANGSLRGQCELAKGLIWQASNTVSQVNRDNRQADTQENRTRKNVFRTGPVYTLQLTQIDQLQFSATYENTEFEEPEEPDSERVSGVVAYNHSFSQTLQGGLSVTAERTELDTQEELDRESAVATFNKVWATTRVSGSLGANRQETRLGSRKVSSDGVTGTFSLGREITPSSEFTLNADRRLTDQTSTLGLQFEDFNFNLTETSAVEVTTVRAGYNNRFSNGSAFGAELSASRSDYVQSGDREERSGINLRYSRPVTELLSWFTDAAYEHQRFEDEGSENDLVSVSLGLDYRLSTRMEVRSAIGHQQKTSDIPSREYDENWVAVSLNYQFF